MGSRSALYSNVVLLLFLLSSNVSYGEEGGKVILWYDEVYYPLDKKQCRRFSRASKSRQEMTLEFLVAEAQKTYMSCEDYEQLYEVADKLKAIESLCEVAKTIHPKIESDILKMKDKVLRSIPLGPKGYIPPENPHSELLKYGQELD